MFTKSIDNIASRSST